MPKYKSNALTDKQVKNTKPPETGLLTLRDGGGLELRISSAGSRTWYHKYYKPFTKKRDNKKLGTYPAVSLKTAREMAEANRRLTEQGIDPKLHDRQQREKREQQSKNTVEAICREWHSHHAEVKAITKDQAVDILRSLELHIFPKLGGLAVLEVTVQNVKATLQPLVEQGKFETIKRVCSRLNMTMRYAINRKYIEVNPIAYIQDEFRKPDVEHLPAIEFEQLPELIRRVEATNMNEFTRLCFYLSLHTVVRPSNAAKARWEDFDLQNMTWHIIKDDMKIKRDFYIPLTEPVLKLLEVAKALYGDSGYVFPANGQLGVAGHMSTQSVNSMLKRAGLQGVHCSHGNRSTASTYMHEKLTDTPNEVIEAALAHTMGKVKKAYHRRNYLEQRRPVMKNWSDYILQCKTKAISKPSF